MDPIWRNLILGPAFYIAFFSGCRIPFPDSSRFIGTWVSDPAFQNEPNETFRMKVTAVGKLSYALKEDGHFCIGSQGEELSAEGKLQTQAWPNPSYGLSQIEMIDSNHILVTFLHRSMEDTYSSRVCHRTR